MIFIAKLNKSCMFLLAKVILLFLYLSPLSGETLRRQTLEDFTKIEGWHLLLKNNTEGGIFISNNELPAKPGSGSYLHIQLSGDKESSFRLQKKEPLFLEGCTLQLSIDVFGFGDFIEFSADFRDIRNKFHRIPVGILKHKDWKTIQIPLSGIRARRIQLNRGRDGIYLEGFSFKTGTNGKVRFLLDNLNSLSGPCVMELKK
jgi:hypothetical protein